MRDNSTEKGTLKWHVPQAVSISISIKAFDQEIVIDRKAPTSHLEDGTNRIIRETECQVLVTGIAGLDRQLRKKVPEEWRNVGTEERSVLSSLGWVRHQRRVYRDEDGRRRKPVDDIWGSDGMPAIASGCGKWGLGWRVKGPSGDRHVN